MIKKKNPPKKTPKQNQNNQPNKQNKHLESPMKTSLIQCIEFSWLGNSAAAQEAEIRRNIWIIQIIMPILSSSSSYKWIKAFSVGLDLS